MKRYGHLLISFIVLLLISCNRTVPVPYNLQCEYLTDPVGIDAGNPTLTWNLDGNIRSGRDIVYRITVAEDSLLLLNGNGLVWDYEVLNPAIFMVRYTGEPLKPRTKYYWRIGSRTGSGNEVHSSISTFTTTDLLIGQWPAQWIELPAQREKTLYLLRKDFTVSNDPIKAYFHISGDTDHFIYINGNLFDTTHCLLYQYGLKDRFYITYDITDLLVPGDNCIGLLTELPTGTKGLLSCIMNTDYRNGTYSYMDSSDGWLYFKPPVSGGTIDPHYISGQWSNYGYDTSQWTECSATPIDTVPFNGNIYPRFTIHSDRELTLNSDSIQLVDPLEPVYGNISLTVRTAQSSKVDVLYGYNNDRTKDGDHNTYIYDQGIHINSDIFNKHLFREVTIMTDSDIEHGRIVINGMEMDKNEDILKMESDNDGINNTHKFLSSNSLYFLSRLYEDYAPSTFNRMPVDISYESVYYFDRSPNLYSLLIGSRISTLNRNYTYLSDRTFIYNYYPVCSLLLDHYNFFGDKELLANNYQIVKNNLSRAVAYLQNTINSNPNIIPQRKLTEVYHDLVGLANIASILGFDTDMQYIRENAEEIRNVANDNYLDTTTGSYGSFRSTVEALYYGLTPERLHAASMNTIYDELSRHPQQSRECKYEILCLLFDKGYGRTGITLLEEFLNSEFIPEDEKNEVYRFMGSLIYKCIAGINPGENSAGFRRIILKPDFNSVPGNFYCEFQSLNGIIGSGWEHNGATIYYITRIPAGCSAELYLPSYIDSRDKIIKLSEGEHRIRLNMK